jgi:hypothetical protein
MKEEEEVAESSESPVLQDQQHRPFTIVYDGKICVHDATEIQVCVCLYMLFNLYSIFKLFFHSARKSFFFFFDI